MPETLHFQGQKKPQLFLPIYQINSISDYLIRRKNETIQQLGLRPLCHAIMKMLGVFPNNLIGLKCNCFGNNHWGFGHGPQPSSDGYIHQSPTFRVWDYPSGFDQIRKWFGSVIYFFSNLIIGNCMMMSTTLFIIRHDSKKYNRSTNSSKLYIFLPVKFELSI